MQKRLVYSSPEIEIISGVVYDDLLAGSMLESIDGGDMPDIQW